MLWTTSKESSLNALLQWVLVACLALASAGVRAQGDVKIGVLSFENKSDTATRWQPTGNYLHHTLPSYTFSFIPLNYDELNAAVKAGDIDYVFTNPEHYVVLRNRFGLSPLVTLNATIANQEVSTFGGVLFARADRTDIQQLSDVRGKRIAAVGLYSLGGFLAVADALRTQHIDLRSSDVKSLTFIGTPHNRVVREVLAGRSDVGIVRTGVLEQMAAQGALELQSVRVLNAREASVYPQLLSSELFPEWPIAAMPKSPPALTKAIGIALMQIQPGASYARAGNYASFSPPANYAAVEELMRRLRVYPEVESVPIWKEVWLDYSETITGTGFALLLLVAGTSVYLLVINRRLQQVTRLYQSSKADLEVTSAAFDTQVGIIVTDSMTRIVRANPAFCKLFGFEESDVLGQDTSLLRSSLIGKGQLQKVWLQLQEHGRWQGELDCQTSTGTALPCIVTITALSRGTHHVTGFVGSFLDISTQKQTEAHIRRLAHFDPLTEMPNRRLFLERLKSAMQAAALNGKVGAIFFIDLDDFKALNDTHGHSVGDQLLKQIPQRLSGLNLNRMFMARLGGDEFVVMLTEVAATETEALQRAESDAWKIREALLMPYALATQSTHADASASELAALQEPELRYNIAASIGVAAFGNPNESVTDVLKRADVAMYQAKQAGKNTIRVFDSEALQTVKLRGLLSTELSTALLEDQFALLYQLQVDTNARPVGAEVLLRWIHPVRGTISPVEFIALAESSGAIVAIGDWVLHQACTTLAQWRNNPERSHLSISVNVSPRQFIEPDFCSKLMRTLESTGAPADRLVLEITEGIVLQNADQVIEKMHKLSEAGVGFSIDDFGTGYSSLSYLHRLPLREIKIDKTFINELSPGSTSESIVRAIIALGNSMQMCVLAEGIETSAQSERLTLLGCQRMQGYLFARPVPLPALESRLTSA